MTYNEFIDMANKPAADTRPSVFALHIYKFSEGLEPEYPEFDIDESVIYSPSYGDAQCRMLELVNAENIYCFQIRQLPLAVAIERDDYSKLWLFDKSGNMIDHSFVSSILTDGNNGFYAPFLGRPQETIRFKPGDIIEYLTNQGTIRIGVILRRPISSDALWRGMRMDYSEDSITPETSFIDFSDDIYLVIDKDSKSIRDDYNVPSTSALPLSLPFPSDLKEQLVANYEKLFAKS